MFVIRVENINTVMSLASFVHSIVLNTSVSELMLHKLFYYLALSRVVNNFVTVLVYPCLVKCCEGFDSSHAVAVTRV